MIFRATYRHCSFKINIRCKSVFVYVVFHCPLPMTSLDISENVKELNIITILVWNQKFMLVTHANTVEPACAKNEMWEFEIIFSSWGPCLKLQCYCTSGPTFRIWHAAHDFMFVIVDVEFYELSFFKWKKTQKIWNVQPHNCDSLYAILRYFCPKISTSCNMRTQLFWQGHDSKLTVTTYHFQD